MKPKCVTLVNSDLRQSETLLHMENSSHISEETSVEEPAWL